MTYSGDYLYLTIEEAMPLTLTKCKVIIDEIFNEDVKEYIEKIHGVPGAEIIVPCEFVDKNNVLNSINGVMSFKFPPRLFIEEAELIENKITDKKPYFQPVYKTTIVGELKNG